ncbi:MAG: ATP-binding protein [Actinomycetota bacterium]
MATAVPVLVSATTTTLIALGGVALGGVLATLWRRPGERAAVADDAAPTEDPGDSSGQRPLADDPRIDRVLGALPLGVVVADPNGEVVYRNRFARQFEGARHGNALVEAELLEIVAAASGGHGEERSVDLYGPPALSVHLKGSPTSIDGELTGAIVIIEDVTAAQQVDRVRKDFVANVSHELRTPVGAIAVLAETLADAREPEIIERLSGRLQNEAHRLSDMIDDLLALSTLESGRITEPDLVDLQQVARAAVERSAEAAQQREVSIVRLASADGPIFVDGDQKQLVSAVSNLLDNAIKYSDVGREVTVGVGGADGRASLTVVDGGIGIPEGDLDRIFERFYRVDDARSRVTGGSGLGLSIVRHVAVNHQGSIGVTSREGRGSTFTLSLPLSSVHQAGRATSDGATSGRAIDPAEESTRG